MNRIPYRSYPILIFFIILLNGICFSQNEARLKIIDSLKTKLESDSNYIYRFRKFRLHLKYSERNSLGNPHIVNFFGPQLGVLINEKHVFALGYYFSTPKTRAGYRNFVDGIETKEYINIQYATFYYQYVLINKRYFEFQFPFELGTGMYKERNIDKNLVNIKNVQARAYIATAGFSFIGKPLSWLGVVTSVGLRQSNISVIDGFYYLFGIRFSLGYFRNDINYYLIKKKKYRTAIKSLGTIEN
ncbi:MAG: hypothetical protein IPM51_04345 [Sphingobacteriaceae bacterium]|nr:hypothetical protein [Sphingobacteriaceae bacterium]